MTDNRDSFADVPLGERVAAGIELLDQQRPGWDEDVDLDSLYLDSCFHCVLGQVFGEFAVGKQALHIQWPDTVRLGFDRDDDDPTGTFDKLSAAWMDAIRARRQVVTG